jgi:hypothetical protein
MVYHPEHERSRSEAKKQTRQTSLRVPGHEAFGAKLQKHGPIRPPDSAPADRLASPSAVRRSLSRPIPLGVGFLLDSILLQENVALTFLCERPISRRPVLRNLGGRKKIAHCVGAARYEIPIPTLYVDGLAILP